MPITDTNFNKDMDEFIENLQQNKNTSAFSIAHNTLCLLRRLIAQTRWSTAKELMDLLKAEGKRITSAKRSETVPRNIVSRVLKLIREEYCRLDQGQQLESTDRQSNLQPCLSEQRTEDEENYTKFFSALKLSALEIINELIAELENSTETIADRALEHIHANEMILTTGDSHTVEVFLKRAAKKRQFHVVVVECAPFFHGHQLAESLGKSNIRTTLITDSAVFAMISRVNKVIIGTNTVLANGGLRANAGTHAIALAAKYYSIPLIVCASVFKFSSQYLCSTDQEDFNEFVSPDIILPFSEGKFVSSVDMTNPVYDYVPPELVTLLISNIGGHAPSYVYRLHSELYGSATDNL